MLQNVKSSENIGLHSKAFCGIFLHMDATMFTQMSDDSRAAILQRPLKPAQGLGEWFKELREERGWSQRDVENKTTTVGQKVDATYLSRIETESRTIDKVDKKMLEALRVIYEQDVDTFETKCGIKLLNKYRLGREKFSSDPYYQTPQLLSTNLSAALRSLSDHATSKCVTSEQDNFAEISVPDPLVKFFVQLAGFEITRERNPKSQFSVFATLDLNVIIIGKPDLLSSGTVAYRNFQERQKDEAPHFIAGHELKYVASIVGYLGEL